LARKSELLLTTALFLGVSHGASMAQAVSPGDLARPAADASAVGEIVVTATRRSQSASRVPMSIAAYSKAALDEEHVRRIDDIARITPSITFIRLGTISGNNTNVSIRGISSWIGAATTGVYIDDTPIQARSLGNTATNAYPLVFDLDRVEVLRGPQGTLFGASSEGGAIRFITPKPSLTTFSAYGRTEVSSIENGGINDEIGLAAGGPVIKDQLGFRASAWYRHDGGWVDRTTPLERGRTTYDTTQKDINKQDAAAFKLAFAWNPIARLSITPSIYYQDQRIADPASFTAAVSNVSSRNYRTANQVEQSSHDHFVLPALQVQYDFGGLSLISNTSYLDRRLTTVGDYTYLDSEIFAGAGPYLKFPGQYARSDFFNTQETFTQEIRLQSAAGGRFSWVVGAFYSHARQEQFQKIVDPYINSLISYDTGGYYNVRSVYGSSLLPGNVFFLTYIHSTDENLAGFAQGDFNVTSKLKLTAGLRVSETTFDTNVLRNGPLAGGLVQKSGSQAETPVTPKVGVSYQYDPNTLFFASAAKGFRPGGAQAALSPIACAADLATYGKSSTPTQFKSDSLWSYETGAKGKFFDGKVQVDASVFLVKWSSIQQAVTFPICGGSFIANAGSVTSRGGDFSVQAHPIANLMLGFSMDYTRATFDKTVYSSGASILKTKGSPLVAPPFSYTVSAEYDFPVHNDVRAYGRADFQHADQGPAPIATDFGFDPLNQRLAAVNQLNLRLGVRPAGMDISLFVDNATDAAPVTLGRVSTSSAILLGVAPRPRTIGLTASMRY
jgi:iron complex outermembrane recepter protein